MGAAYILTGSINQACVEAGTSEAARLMLAQAEQADTMMAPAADMFEMGVKVQVLKRGTMFPMRATKLYELYRTFAGLEEIPSAERTTLEKTIFRASLAEIWRQTREFFEERDPRQSSAPSAIRNIGWPSYSAGIWANRLAGPRAVSRRGKSIIKFGVGRLWAPLTNGSRARFLSRRRIVAWFRWP